MIKKFEEFVNEMYSQRKDYVSYERETVDYLSTLGVSDEDCREIYDIAKKSGVGYSAEDVENILKRLPGCDSIEGIVDAVKTVFFGEDNKILSDWVENHNGDLNKCPIVLDDYSGKLLTGVVWYCGALDKYSDDDSSFENEGLEYLMQDAWSEGYSNDGGEEYAYEHFEDLEIDKVDLDKEYDWKYDGHLEHLK
jgi:hypothetical protein